MVTRVELQQTIERAIRTNAVTAIIGPRQCGKTTVAREIAQARRAAYFDLEDPTSLARLAEPMFTLSALRGLVVIDEVQFKPDLFPVLRVLADRRPLPARFLVLGSASPDLLQQGSESLAGRIAFIEMGGFSLSEMRAMEWRRLWWRGGFPRSFLARSEHESRAWRDNFIQTFLERDIRQFGVQVTPVALRRLWSMLAHYHAQIWNGSDISRSLGEAHTTVKKHLDILTGALMVRQLQPWFENLGKRQVKAPKVYLRDSGLLHAFLGIPSFSDLEGHPKIGASWEGFVVEEVAHLAGSRNVYFWASHSGAELDLLLFSKGRRYGIEIKYAGSPAITKSMRIALEDLRLERLFIVYPGTEFYALDPKVDVVPLAQLRQKIPGLAAARRR